MELLIIANVENSYLNYFHVNVQNESPFDSYYGQSARRLFSGGLHQTR